jgi:hypothetical protein
MKNTNLTLGTLLAAAMLCGSLGIAQMTHMPADNISARRHPNLAAAQRMVQNAYEKTIAAQQANEWDMGGHAQKAKELLDQASRELKMAAEDANKDRK